MCEVQVSNKCTKILSKISMSHPYYSLLVRHHEKAFSTITKVTLCQQEKSYDCYHLNVIFDANQECQCTKVIMQLSLSGNFLLSSCHQHRCHHTTVFVVIIIVVVISFHSASAFIVTSLSDCY